MSSPIITVQQMREWEKATWDSGQTEWQVIRQVGQLVAARVLKMTRRQDRILVLAGKGHNGDDARAALPGLAKRQVELLVVSDPAGSRSELQDALRRNPNLIIDGLFGIGLDRPLDKRWMELIQQVNQAGSCILSVDVPSGLNADTGTAQPEAIRAAITLTLGAPKRGLLSASAWPYVGRLDVAQDIGLIDCPLDSDLHFTLPDDFGSYPPDRPIASHKGNYGHLAIVAGSLGFHGAAVLAARGAMRAQPGLITVFPQENVYLPTASQLAAVMVRPWDKENWQPDHFSALLWGPGLAHPDLPAELKSEFLRLWREFPRPMIVDASALEWLPAGSIPSNALRVMTPHPGEAARLLDVKPAEIQVDRPAALRQLSGRYARCIVVLKGHQTLVGQDQRRTFVNGSGNPYLAQGGSGDVLAGYLAGLLAQPTALNDPMINIQYGVWQHGRAAERATATKSNWTTEELVESLGQT